MLMRQVPELARWPLAAARVSWVVCSVVCRARQVGLSDDVLVVGDVIRSEVLEGALPEELAAVVRRARLYPEGMEESRVLARRMELLEEVGGDLLTELPR
ncbi:hypothetical protein ACFVWN_01450 [Nocardiopsis flavescens]